MIKNIFIRFIFVCLRLFARNKIKPQERFLIISTTALGDTLWGTPAIRTLRQSYPQAYIAILTSSLGQELLKYNPHLSDCFILPSSPIQIAKLLWKLYKKKIDTVLVFHTSQRIALPLASLLMPRRIIGSLNINKGLDFLLTDPIPQKEEHEIARRLRIAAKAGAIFSSPCMEIFLSPQDEQIAENFLPHLNTPIIALHPGAKDRFKQWNPDCFAKVGIRLQKEIGAQIIVTGTGAERPLMDSIAKQIPGAIILSEGFPIRALAALFKRCSLVISNDTGPMHVAYAMKTPTLSLFGPTDARLCGPYFLSHAIAIQTEKTCTPCIRKRCKEPFCLFQISPESVYKAAVTLLDCRTGGSHGV